MDSNKVYPLSVETEDIVHKEISTEKTISFAQGKEEPPQNVEPAIDDPPTATEGNRDGHFRFRLAKQACLVGMWLSLGLIAEITGPTLPDLTTRIGVNFEEISRALVGKSIGMMFGSLVGGFLHDRFPQYTDLFIGVGFMLSATTLALIPWMPNIGLIATMLAVNGFVEGEINIGGNIVVMHLWGLATASPMMSLHFGFGLGAVIAPQLARPFLAPDRNTTLLMENTFHSDDSRIEIPYMIIGIFSFLFAFVVLGFHFKGYPEGFPQRKPTKDFRRMITPASCAGGHFATGLSLLIALFFYFIQAVGGERAYGKFLFSFATEGDLKLPRATATTLNSVFWMCFTCGRLFGIPMAKFIPTSGIIIIDIIGNLACSITLAVVASSSATGLWVCTGFIGFFIAQIFPSGMSWGNDHLQMNSMAVMILIVGGSCGGFIYQYLPGYLFENNGPHSLMYVMVGYSLLLLIVYAVMEILAKVFGQRQSMDMQELDEEVVIEADTPTGDSKTIKY